MQINRLFEIIYILLERHNVTASELSERFEVSQRTIYRDVEALSQAGIPIYMTKGKGGGIALLPDFILNKAVLTKEDKSEILSSLKAVSAVNLDEDNNVLKKLKNLLGEHNTDWIEVDFSSWSNLKEEEEIFKDIKTAIINKRIISFDYCNVKGENINRIVCPLKLCFKGQGWYLYGYCKTRNDNRFFKLKRIHNLCISNEVHNLIAGKKVMKSESAYKNEFVTLTMKISSKMAYRVYDEFEDYNILDDGRFIVKIRYPKGEWLYSYIASFGEECEIIEPLDIREKYINKLKKMINIYS